MPVYGTRLTVGLIKGKLREHRILERCDVREYQAGDRVPVGRIDVEPFRINHSIPDAVGLAIRTPLGTVVHTGDFKFDQTPVDGMPADFARIARIGDEGVLVLCSDSTYAERPGYTPSEQVISAAFQQVFHEAPGRVIVATFASLIARIQQVIDAAVRTGRKVAVTGRSMIQNTEIALELGYLTAPKGTLIRQEEIGKYSDRELAIVTTGSQGEPMSSLARMANREHRWIKIAPGDTIVISATPIPGNDLMINRTIDNLFKQGADVLYSRISDVHVQGHASQEELKMMLNLVRPKYFVPVHGEFRMLVRHARLARSVGIDDDHIFVMEDGEVLEITEAGASVADRIPINEVYVDGLAVGDVTNVVLRDRQQLATDGIIVVIFEVDRRTTNMVDQPDIFSRGFVYPGDFNELVDKSRELMANALRADSTDHLMDYKFITAKVRETLGRYVYEQTRHRPMILPVVVEV